MSHRTQLVAVYKQQQGKAHVCGAFLRIIEQGCNLISCYWLVIRSDWESLGGGSKDTRARLAAGSLSLVSILTSSLGEMCLGVCGMDEGEEVASASFLPRREVDRTRPLPGNCTSLSWRVSGTASCGVVGSSSWCLGPLPPSQGDPPGIREARAGGAAESLPRGGAGRAGCSPGGRGTARAGAGPGAGASAGAWPREQGCESSQPGLPPPGQGGEGAEPGRGRLPGLWLGLDFGIFLFTSLRSSRR